MTNERPVKCPACEQHFQRSITVFVKHKNRYWHKSCYEKEADKAKDKEKLLRYIEKLLRKKVDYKITNQIKTYTKDKRYTHKDIHQALYYFYEIKNNSTAKANGGIGIVPYVIDEAKAYFKEKYDRIEKSENTEIVHKHKVITISDPAYHPRYANKKIIDISDI